ncbi:MAG: polysaccharide biosynthesis C-terminal domain-containing protein [Planctomycetota bacterium]
MTQDRELRVLGDQLLLSGAQGLRLALGLVATVLLMRGLPDALWADYVLVATALATALQFVDGGFGAPLAAALASPAGGAALWRRVFALRGFVATLLAFAALPFLGLAVNGLEGGARLAVAALAFLCLAAAPWRGHASVLVAARIERPRALISIGSQIVFLAGVALAITLGEGSLALALALASLLVRESISSVAVAWAARGRTPPPPEAGATRAALAPVLLATAVGAVYLNADVFLVAALRGSTELARYGDASRLAGPLVVLPALLVSPLVPATARGRAGGVAGAAVAGAALLAPGLAGLAVAGDEVVRLARGGAAPGAGITFSWLALAVLGVLLGQSASVALHAAGRSADWARVAVLGLVLNVGLDLALIPGHGAVGAGIATFSAELAVGLAALVLARRGARGPGLRVAPACLAVGLAAGATAVVAFSAPSRYRLLVGALAAAAATAFVAFAPPLRRLRAELVAGPSEEGN